MILWSQNTFILSRIPSFPKVYKVLAHLMNSWFARNVDFTKVLKVFCVFGLVFITFLARIIEFPKVFKVFEPNLDPFLVPSVPFRARPG